MLRILTVCTLVLASLAGCTDLLGDDEGDSGSEGGSSSGSSSAASQAFAAQMGAAAVKEGTSKEKAGCFILENWVYDADDGEFRMSGIYCGEAKGPATLSAKISGCSSSDDGRGATIMGEFDGTVDWKLSGGQPPSGTINGDSGDFQNGFAYSQMSGTSGTLTLERNSNFSATSSDDDAQFLMGMLFCDD